MADTDHDEEGSIDIILNRGGYYDMTRRAQRRPKGSADDTVPILLAEAALLSVVPAQLLKLIQAGDLGAGIWIVPESDWVDPVGNVLSGWATHAWVMERPSKLDTNDAAVAANYLAEGRSVHIVTPKEKIVPPVLRTVADATITLPTLTAKIVGQVIKKVSAGRLPPRMEQLDLSVLDFGEVAAVLGNGGSGAEILRRLEAAIERKRKPKQIRDETLPDLEHAVEYGAARLWAMELKTDLDGVRSGALGWSDVDKGCLLTSVPGCGKSLFSLALGEYLEVPVFQTSMGELFASGPGYLDSVVKAMRSEFEKARAAAPSVLFIDEIDSLPRADGGNGRHDNWWRTVAAEFLLLLDSATSDRGGVIVIGATNHPRDIHRAITRPGRLERIIHIEPPDAEGAERVLRHHLRGELDGIEISDIAAIAAGDSWTPAQLMEAVRAARRVARNGKRQLEHQDLLARFRTAEDRTEEELRVVSAHEAGHALVAALLQPECIVSSTIEKGRAGSGGRLQIEFEDGIVTRQHFTDRAKIYLAGRAAELVLIGSATLGSGGSASSDLGLATAELAELHLSMGGGSALRWRCAPQDAAVHLHRHPAIQVEVEAELAQLFDEVLEIVRRHRPELEQLADLLLEHRTISGNSIRGVVLGSGYGHAIDMEQSTGSA